MVSIGISGRPAVMISVRLMAPSLVQALGVGRELHGVEVRDRVGHRPAAQLAADAAPSTASIDLAGQVQDQQLIAPPHRSCRPRPSARWAAVAALGVNRPDTDLLGQAGIRAATGGQHQVVHLPHRGGTGGRRGGSQLVALVRCRGSPRGRPRSDVELGGDLRRGWPRYAGAPLAPEAEQRRHDLLLDAGQGEGRSVPPCRGAGPPGGSCPGVCIGRSMSIRWITRSAGSDERPPL